MSNIITTDFEPSSAAAWKQKIQFELNGADYNETLLTKTNEGITIKPFYHSDHFEKLNIPITKDHFKICCKLLITSEEETNLKALDAIRKAANSIKGAGKGFANIGTKVLTFFKNTPILKTILAVLDKFKLLPRKLAPEIN